jgi:hypothetical protein
LQNLETSKNSKIFAKQTTKKFIKNLQKCFKNKTKNETETKEFFAKNQNRT